MRGWFLLFCGWWCAQECRAQETIFSLDECVAYALKNRTEIAISENSGKDIKRAVGYLRQQQLPDLNGAYAHQMNWGRSLNTEKYEWEDSKNQYGNLSLSSSLTLFAGLRMRHQIRAGKLSAARDESVHRKLQNEVKLEVIQAFYEVLATRANKELTEAFYELDRQQEKRMRMLDSVKRVSEPDRLETVGQLQKALIEKQNAEKQYRLAMLRLKKSMNYRGKEALRIKEEKVAGEIAPSAEDVYAKALRSLPDVKLQCYDSLLLRNQLKILRGSFSPVLSLGGTFYTRYQNRLDDPVTGKNYSVWKQLRDNNYKQVGISLSIPFFNRSGVRQQIREVKTKVLNQRLKGLQLLADIRDEIERICLEAKVREENYRVLAEQEKNYCEIYRLRQIQYSHGKLSIYDLLTAETNWKNVRTNLSVERYNLHCYLEMIEFYQSGGKYSCFEN